MSFKHEVLRPIHKEVGARLYRPDLATCIPEQGMSQTTHSLLNTQAVLTTGQPALQCDSWLPHFLLWLCPPSD